MNNVEDQDQKAQIVQLQHDRIYEMLKELNDDKLINRCIKLDISL